jgi:hypothetical protein
VTTEVRITHEAFDRYLGLVGDAFAPRPKPGNRGKYRPDYYPPLAPVPLVWALALTFIYGFLSVR